MNERIKELAEQAKDHADHLDKIGVDTSMEDIFNQMFAELIVRDCIKLCKHESNDDEYDQYDMGMSVKADDIKSSIMKEFGVEE